MPFDLFSGVFDLPWWGLALVALGLTHITIVCVTLYLHRSQTHHAIDLHPAVAHFFRFWLWLTTGMVTREWVAVHRKHHAKCETAEDPHSPMFYGINGVLWGGVFLYVKESSKPETVQRYGNGAPDDWIERKLYSRYVLLGLTSMGFTNVLLFGIVPGVLILATQIVWIPFWAAGVINGVGHYWGYRNHPTEDASTNIVPLAMIIGGEELHNNHHAFATSAKFSMQWYEFDLGWLYIRILQALGLATVKHVAPVPRFVTPRPVVDAQMLETVIHYRYDVLRRYTDSLKSTLRDELARLQNAPEAGLLRKLRGDLVSGKGQLTPELDRALSAAPALKKAIDMRTELQSLWGRSMASREQLVAQLQDWCHRAEQSGIAPLVNFSQRLRSYA